MKATMMTKTRTQTNIFKGVIDGGHVTANGKNLPLSNRGRKSSPTGFAWGYGGSGPFALAHSMLKHLFGEVMADQHATAFKFEVIARLNPDESFELPYADVRSWMQKRSWALNASQSLAELPVASDDAPFGGDDDADPSFESLTDMSQWTETRAILVRDPETGEITVHPDTPPTPRPLTSDEEGLLELAEGIADGLESGDIILVDDNGVPVTFVDTDAVQRDHDEAMGAVMFLDFQHAAFMERVCSFDGLVIWHHDEIGMGMALKLEKGGLVTIDRSMLGGVVVSAVRPDGEE